jgi:hypothetical protein
MCSGVSFGLYCNHWRFFGVMTDHSDSLLADVYSEKRYACFS